MSVTLSATADSLPAALALLSAGEGERPGPSLGESLGAFAVRAFGYPSGPDGQPVPLTHTFDGNQWVPAP